LGLQSQYNTPKVRYLKVRDLSRRLMVLLLTLPDDKNALLETNHLGI
jgi:hypothetical protein